MNTCVIGNHRYELEVGPAHIAVVPERNDDGRPLIGIIVVRPTQFFNIIWIRVISIGFFWPPVRNVACFTDIEASD